jgi:hypothetical protein
LNLNLLGHLCYDRHKFFSNALDLNQFFDLMGGIYDGDATKRDEEREEMR